MKYQNEAYKKMVETMEDYQKRSDAYEAEKKSKREELSNDDFWAWVKETGKPEYPFTNGQSAALSLVHWHKGEGYLDLKDHIWTDDVKDFVDTLRAFGVDKFAVTCKSSGLMEDMHEFVANGCKLVGLCEVEEERYRKIEMKQGVLFEL